DEDYESEQAEDKEVKPYRVGAKAGRLELRAVGDDVCRLSLRVQPILLATDQREFRRDVPAREARPQTPSHGQPIGFARPQQLVSQLQVSLQRVRNPCVCPVNLARERR